MLQHLCGGAAAVDEVNALSGDTPLPRGADDGRQALEQEGTRLPG